LIVVEVSSTNQVNKEMLDRLQVLNWDLDLDGIVKDCNKTACKLLEWSKEDMVGMMFADDLLAEFIGPVGKAAVQMALRGDAEYKVELSCLTFEDAELVVSADFEPQRCRGEVVGCIITAKIMDPDEVRIKLNMDGTVQAVNTYAMSLLDTLEVEDQGLVGQNFVSDMIPTHAQKDVQRAIEKAKAAGRVKSVDIPLSWKHGTNLTMNCDLEVAREKTGAADDAKEVSRWILISGYVDESTAALDAMAAKIKHQAEALSLLEGGGSSDELFLQVRKVERAVAAREKKLAAMTPALEEANKTNEIAATLETRLGETMDLLAKSQARCDALDAEVKDYKITRSRSKFLFKAQLDRLEEAGAHHSTQLQNMAADFEAKTVDMAKIAGMRTVKTIISTMLKGGVYLIVK